MELTINLSPQDQYAIAQLLAATATYHGEGDTHELPTMRGLVETLLTGIAELIREPNSLAFNALRLHLEQVGYRLP